MDFLHKLVSRNLFMPSLLHWIIVTRRPANILATISNLIQRGQTRDAPIVESTVHCELNNLADICRDEVVS